jgi:hypothetical protein
MTYAELGYLPFPVYGERTISLHQLIDEVSRDIGYEVEGVLESGSTDQNPKIKCKVWINGVKNLDDLSKIRTAVADHVPIRHYGYPDDLVKLHDAWVCLLTGTLSVDDHGDALRAMALVLRGDLPDCDCTEPLKNN